MDHSAFAHPDFSVNRFGFYLETLARLRDDMRAIGGDLIALESEPEKSFPLLLRELKRRHIPLPSAWSRNRDYEPLAVARDARVQALLEGELGIPFHTERDHLLIEPSELYKGEERGTFYQVFTPFKKKWLKLFATEEMQRRVAFRAKPSFKMKWSEVLGQKHRWSDVLDDYRDKVRKQLTVPLPPAGENAALAQLKRFTLRGLSRYARDRDFPALPGTSQISMYLSNGSLTVAGVISKLARKSGTEKYLEQLIWREFYYHILAHVPRVEHTAFNFKYEKLKWENNPAHLAAWKEGRTGYPIIDAAMRELKETGWMHNRMRMVVASFLTKDLHCDWKLGERYFMQELIDGDLASNNGGWQWAASTGCDPQPYFRIFNPLLQSRRFDPQGTYIRKWVPELRECTSKEIHAPWSGDEGPVDYPKPIVEHGVEAKKAVAMYSGQKQG